MRSYHRDLAEDDGSSFEMAPFDEGLAEIELRRDKELQVSLGEDIQADLAEMGPLGVFVAQRRALAINPLCLLVAMDPSDGPNIAKAQASVNEYLQVRSFIQRAQNDAMQAAHEIDEEFGRAERRS